METANHLTLYHVFQRLDDSLDDMQNKLRFKKIITQENCVDRLIYCLDGCMAPCDSNWNCISVHGRWSLFSKLGFECAAENEVHLKGMFHALVGHQKSYRFVGFTIEICAFSSSKHQITSIDWDRMTTPVQCKTAYFHCEKFKFSLKYFPKQIVEGEKNGILITSSQFHASYQYDT